MQLSKNFALREFLRSETAARHDIDMWPPDAVLRNLERLANEILEPIRKVADCPLYITSGYRPMELNRLVGGTLNSDHQYGRAVDVVAPSLELHEFARIVRRASDDLPLAKAIIEFGAWVHISIEPLGAVPRRQYLLAMRQSGQTIYLPWENV